MLADADALWIPLRWWRYRAADALHRHGRMGKRLRYGSVRCPLSPSCRRVCRASNGGASVILSGLGCPRPCVTLLKWCIATSQPLAPSIKVRVCKESCMLLSVAEVNLSLCMFRHSVKRRHQRQRYSTSAQVTWQNVHLAARGMELLL
ncbi:hypothetical protein BU23DRAFT_247269 [Bimuria novae-zelandiae CBS 107.79]|uniref:Uncharacterized protein n=1 Tax=Bimuria novae-zelandiae CBS 107.79 TaxID=1447943 RepID=A0A6A5UWB8_9PLEO|nr:hypothetical protein BU23DRAFT_247269 [Bimuria novae-zelandiae CBS 107.79]